MYSTALPATAFSITVDDNCINFVLQMRIISDHLEWGNQSSFNSRQVGKHKHVLIYAHVTLHECSLCNDLCNVLCVHALLGVTACAHQKIND